MCTSETKKLIKENQAFETVVPSERTRLNFSVSECSIQLAPTTHPGAFVISLCDVGFATDIVGDSPESIVNVFGSELSMFLVDDCGTLTIPDDNSFIVSDSEHWMVGNPSFQLEISL